MILSRFSRAIRQQNWFAVVLEFVIVIAGVVIGFQVTAWYSDRQERELEQVYLQSLHDEAVHGLDGMLGNIDFNWSAQRDALDQVLAIFAEDPPETTRLTDAQCDAMLGIGSIIAFPYQFPTLKEILASGRLSIIGDVGLRAALTDYDLMHDNSQSVVSFFTRRPTALHLDFPHLVTERYVLGADGAEQRTVCDLAGMRTDPDFIAHLFDGVSTFNGYHSIVLRREVDSVQALHDRLHALPGITHEAENP